MRSNLVVEFGKLFAVPAPRRVELHQDVRVRVSHVRVDRLRAQVGDDGFGVHVRSQVRVEPLHRGREGEISAEPRSGRVRHPGVAIVPVVVAEQRDVRCVGDAEGCGEALVRLGVDRPEDEFFMGGGSGIGMAGSSSSSLLLSSRCFLCLAGFIIVVIARQCKAVVGGVCERGGDARKLRHVPRTQRAPLHGEGDDDGVVDKGAEEGGRVERHQRSVGWGEKLRRRELLRVVVVGGGGRAEDERRYEERDEEERPP